MHCVCIVHVYLCFVFMYGVYMCVCMYDVCKSVCIGYMYVWYVYIYVNA